MTSRSSRLMIATTLTVALATLAGCAPESTALVRILDSGTSSAVFEPAVLVVKAGTEVRWRNSSARQQSIMTSLTADDEDAIPAGAQPWESGDLRPGDTFAVRLDVPGFYVYTGSEPDGAMVATIEVEAP